MPTVDWIDLYDSVENAVEPLSEKDGGYWHDRLLAIIWGGIEAAGAIERVHKPYFDTLGPLDADGALEMLSVTSTAIANRWVRRWSTMDPNLEHERAWTALITDVLRLFDEDVPERLEEAWCLNAQFNFGEEQAEAEGNISFLWGELRLLTALCASSRGAELPWSLSRPFVPLGTLYDFHRAGCNPPTGLDWTDIGSLGELVMEMTLAEAACLDHFRALQRERE